MTREEAIRRIKAWNLDADDMEVLSEVIPELRESDNKIHREWILEYLYDGLQKSDEQFKGLFKSAIDWLEKQKEQRDYRKLYEDIAQSEWFKKAYVGKGTDDESLISNVQIEEEFPKIIPDEKMKQMGEEISKAVVDYINEQFSKIVEKEQKPVRDIVPGDAIESCMLRYLQSAANRNDDIDIIEDTKAYKSELISIIEKEKKPAEVTINGEPIPTKNQSVDIPLAEWSEEDEERKQSILFSIGYCKDEYPNRKDYSKDIDWLKSLSLNLKKKNEDVEKLCSNEWSEEDERIRKDLIKYLKSDRNYQPCQDVSFYDSSIGWLEKQKECGEANFREGYLHGFEDAQKEQKPVPINSDDKYMLERTMALIEFCDDKEIIWSWLCEKVKVATQKPAEWSKEDETCLTNTLIMLKEYAIHHYSKDDVNKSVNWLENRVKSLRPQPHTVSIKDATKFGNLEYERGVKDGIQHAKNHQWKPSEGQMQALSESIAFAPDTFKPKCTLVTLQDDLKKLMEE